MNIISLKRKTVPVCIILLGIFAHKNALCREYINALPPPETPQVDFVPEYHVTVILNGRTLDNRMPIRITDSHYLIPRIYLKHKIPVPARYLVADNSPFVDISVIPGVKSRYDAEQHALVVDIPPEWLPDQTLSAAHPTEDMGYSPAAGMALDYDAYTSHNRWLDAGSLYLGGAFLPGRATCLLQEQRTIADSAAAVTVTRSTFVTRPTTGSILLTQIPL